MVSSATDSRGGLYLGFDVGTQSTKALVLDADSGEVVARAQEPYELISSLPPGHMEQHPDTWIAALQRTAATVLARVDRTRIRGVSVSGQQHGAVVLDEQQRVVRPAKLWCDTSTASEARALSQAIGRAVPTGFTASKLRWLKIHEPQNWARVRHVLLPHDYVNLRLCGTATMECGDASGTGFFDPIARQFDPRAMAAIDARLPSMLPPLLPPGAPAGSLSSAGAALLSLPVGLPVAHGGGDNMMAAIGSGAAANGVAVVSLGTSGTVFARSSNPTVDREGLIAPFCSSDGAYLPLLCVMNLTGVTETVRRVTGLSHDALTKLASAVPMGSDGLLWLPFLNGERVPDLPTATGTLLSMRGDNLSPGHLYRAALEGTSCNLAAGARRLQQLGVDLREVRLCGGASHNPLWQQILADLFEVPVVLVAEPEAAALGAAISALWTVRRLAGDDVSCAEVAAKFVHTVGEPVRPSSDLASSRELRARFAFEVERLHGVRILG
ncbi:MAG: xylulokinase [Planctomycetota bacterium]